MVNDESDSDNEGLLASWKSNTESDNAVAYKTYVGEKVIFVRRDWKDCCVMVWRWQMITCASPALN